MISNLRMVIRPRKRAETKTTTVVLQMVKQPSGPAGELSQGQDVKQGLVNEDTHRRYMDVCREVQEGNECDRLLAETSGDRRTAITKENRHSVGACLEGCIEEVALCKSDAQSFP